MKNPAYYFTIALLLSLSSLGFGQSTSSYKAIVKQAEQLYQSKDYQASLEQYELAFQQNDKNKIDLYNAACSASLVGDVTKANTYLTASIDQNYIDINWLEKDTDFAALRATSRWSKIIKRIKSKIAEVETLFSKVVDYDLSELVPFTANGKWGYLDKATKAIVIPAQLYDGTFGGSCLTVSVFENELLKVDASGKVASIRLSDLRGRRPPPPPHAPDNHAVTYGPRPDYQGFRVDERGRIIYASLSIDKEDSFYERPAIYGPYKINNKWYALAKKKGVWGLIDEEGIPLPEMPLSYQKLKPVKIYKGKDYWFYGVDESGKHGFISTTGEKKFYDLFDQKSTERRLYESRLGIQTARTKDGKFGVFSLETMKWLLEPMEERIIGLEWSYKGSCRSIPSSNTGRILDFYVLVLDAEKNQYFMGMDGEKYLPK